MLRRKSTRSNLSERIALAGGIFPNWYNSAAAETTGSLPIDATASIVSPFIKYAANL